MLIIILFALKYKTFHIIKIDNDSSPYLMCIVQMNGLTLDDL